MIMQANAEQVTKEDAKKWCTENGINNLLETSSKVFFSQTPTNT